MNTKNNSQKFKIQPSFNNMLGVLKINKPIFKESFKTTFRFWLIFAILLGVVIFLLTLVFGRVIEDMDTDMPMLNAESTLELVGEEYYGLMALIIALVYIIITGNNLIAAKVDKGTMAYTLSAPIKRSKVVYTQGAFFIFSLFAIVLIVYVCGVIAGSIDASSKENENFQIGTFTIMNVAWFVLLFALSSIVFIASCSFNLSRYSLGVGGGITAIFALFTMISQMSEDLEFFKYITINSLYNATSIVEGTNYWVYEMVILLVLGIVLYGGGLTIFIKKDLPL